VFAGSRGGLTRARVIRALIDRPLNANQLARALDLDYTTVVHHLRVLEENGLLTGVGPKYGRTYFLTEKMASSAEMFQSIWVKLDAAKDGDQEREGNHGKPV